MEFITSLASQSLALRPSQRNFASWYAASIVDRRRLSYVANTSAEIGSPGLHSSEQRERHLPGQGPCSLLRWHLIMNSQVKDNARRELRHPTVTLSPTTTSRQAGGYKLDKGRAPQRFLLSPLNRPSSSPRTERESLPL
jgi:hypothetical protein